MSLDSVELLINVEKHFDIYIPDPEAAQIYTLQNFADCVYAKVSTNPSERCKSKVLFYKLRIYFQNKFNIAPHDFYPQKRIGDLIAASALPHTWKMIERDFEVRLPELTAKDLHPEEKNNIKVSIRSLFQKDKSLSHGTIGDLVHWMLAMNHQKFIDVNALCSKRDIEMIIIGIVSESVGIPVDELRLTHRITDDLGID
jgi:hypothetical protein